MRTLTVHPERRSTDADPAAALGRDARALGMSVLACARAAAAIHLAETTRRALTTGPTGIAPTRGEGDR